MPGRVCSFIVPEPLLEHAQVVKVLMQVIGAVAVLHCHMLHSACKGRK